MWQCMEDTIDLLNICKKRFPKTTCSYVSVPSFTCAQNGFILCSLDEVSNLIEKISYLGILATFFHCISSYLSKNEFPKKNSCQ